MRARMSGGVGGAGVSPAPTRLWESAPGWRRAVAYRAIQITTMT